MHLMFCVSGFSGTGKDEFCRSLVEKHNAMHTGLADPAKRHMADIYGFTRDQLFGPSAMRNAGDPRYPKTSLTSLGAKRTAESKHWYFDVAEGDRQGWEGLQRFKTGNNIRYFVEETDPRFFLSPREALQLYCDLMNQLYLCTWVRAGVDVHRKLAEWGDKEHSGGAQLRWTYDRMTGLMPNDGSRFSDCGDVVTCFSDFRHWHEIRYVREAATQFEDFTPVLIRVKRPGVDKPPFNHRSETEQATIPDSEFDYVVDNNSTIEGLHAVADQIVAQVKARAQ